jgi:hypothetical protein
MIFNAEDAEGTEIAERNEIGKADVVGQEPATSCHYRTTSRFLSAVSALKSVLLAGVDAARAPVYLSLVTAKGGGRQRWRSGRRTRSN